MHSRYVYDGESGPPPALCVFIPLVNLAAPKHRHVNLAAPRRRRGATEGSGAEGNAGDGGNTGDGGNAGYGEEPNVEVDGSGAGGQHTQAHMSALDQRPAQAQVTAGDSGTWGAVVVHRGVSCQLDLAVEHGRGCTTWWPGSHRYAECARIGAKAQEHLHACIPGAPLRAGAALVYDLRVVHTGSPNDATGWPGDEGERPILQLTYSSRHIRKENEYGIEQLFETDEAPGQQYAAFN